MYRAYQHYPELFGIISIAAVIAIYQAFRASSILSDEDILSSVTSQSLASPSYYCSIYISIGVLIPVMIDQAYAVLQGFLSPGIDKYLLPCLVLCMQLFNVYFVSGGHSVDAYWAFFIAASVKMIVVSNVVLAIQISIVNHSLTLIRVTVATALLLDVSIIVYTLYVVNGWVACRVITILLRVVVIGCCVYIGYNWYDRYVFNRKAGLAYLENYYAFVIMVIFVLFQLVMIVSTGVINYSLAHDFSQVEVIGVQVMFMLFYYIFVQVTSLLVKYQAQLSMDALETKRAFVRYVSHEIRTALNAACLGLQVLEQEIRNMDGAGGGSLALNSSVSAAERRNERTNERSEGNKEVLMELVADTSQACTVAVDILNDLLMYEKIDGGLMVLEPQEILIGIFVEEVMKMFTMQAKAKSIEIVLHRRISQKMFVTIDVHKMSQVMRNLLSNALKFSPDKGKVVITIDIVNHEPGKVQPGASLEDAENGMVGVSNMMFGIKNNLNRKSVQPFVRISVQDSGPGISKENQKRLFTEVVQFDAARLQGGNGSGVGLWVSSHIMKLHGGKIDVKSEGEGHGSTFFIDIPIAWMENEASPRRRQSSVIQKVLQSFIAADPIGSIEESSFGHRNICCDQAHFSVFTSTFGSDLHGAGWIDPILDHQQQLLRTPADVLPLPIENPSDKLKPSDLHKVAPDPQDQYSMLSKVDEFRGAGKASRQLVRRASSLRGSFIRVASAISSSFLVAKQDNNELTTAMTTTMAIMHDGLVTKPDTRSQRRVLIVDDSAVNRKMLRNLMRNYFDVCDEGVDGEDGLQKYHLLRAQLLSASFIHSLECRSYSHEDDEENCDLSRIPCKNTTYDLIITDYWMPRMNGIELVEKLRACGYGGQIIGLTGNTEASMKEAFLAAGANEMLIKPVQGKVIQQIVEALFAAPATTTHATNNSIYPPAVNTITNTFTSF